jgi:hypothetical protein
MHIDVPFGAHLKGDVMPGMTDRIQISICDPSLINFNLFIEACKLWLDNRESTEPQNGVKYRYVPDEEFASTSLGDVLRFLFDYDEFFITRGEVVPFILTKLCAQALDPEKKAVRYVPDKCSIFSDKHGVSGSLCQESNSFPCYHNLLLIIEKNGKWVITIDGCWGSGCNDGIDPIYFPERYFPEHKKYSARIQGEQKQVLSFSSSGETPVDAFLLWNIDVPRLRT